MVVRYLDVGSVFLWMAGLLTYLLYPCLNSPELGALGMLRDMLASCFALGLTL